MYANKMRPFLWITFHFPICPKKLVEYNNHRLATELYNPSKKEDAAKKLADIGEKTWIKK
jgi:hypothetical protein